MTREDIENNVGYWQEKANLEYIKQRQEHGVNDPYMITEIDEAFDAGYDKGYQYALQHPQWIPVEERLPEEGQVVFIYTKHGSVSSVTYKDGAFNLNEVLEAINVTHWMEIVPPRKED